VGHPAIVAGIEHIKRPCKTGIFIQKPTVSSSKDGGVGPNAQRQGGNRSDGESGAFRSIRTVCLIMLNGKVYSL
jgi:hypothetical protein